MEHVQIVRDIANANWTKMREIYESVGWVKHTEPIIQRVFQASHISSACLLLRPSGWIWPRSVRRRIQCGDL